MMRHIKKFCNVQFKIAECEDDIIGDDSSDSDEEDKNSDNSSSEDAEDPKSVKKVKSTTDKPTEFPKSFIFSCIGIGLTNIARKTE